jgi:hypothetical protein
MSDELVASINAVAGAVKKHIKQNKLADLADAYGMDVDEMLQQGMFDGVCPAICMNENCDYTTDMEPDQDRGYCDVCGTNTVKSALVLAGVI